VKATAKKNQNVLREMITQKDADKVGEFSLTDKRFSRIDTFMANTLFDENIGGIYGNTHLALGMSYVDTYDGDVSKVTKQELNQLGFNNIYCSVHTDIISTLDRKVTAVLKDGSQKLIYAHGQFVL
jgi:aminopeptidase